jgi:hypothetical protein
MANIEIAQTIVKETQGLSSDALQEVLDFIQFIKMREYRARKKHLGVGSDVDAELRLLDMSSLAHLEEEFANYKELFPHE